VTTQTSTAPSTARKGEPGVFIILRPESAAYPIIRRVSREAHGERTGKDFVDFFGNLSVLVHFGPLTRELIEDPEAWRELIPGCGQGLDAERVLFTGGRSGQELMIVFLTDSSTRSELPRWKELLRWIVGRFY
jgi:hypothetical protein